MNDILLTDMQPGDPIQLHPAWQRGYDARMYGVVENKEVGFCAILAYERGVRDAGVDEDFDYEDYRRGADDANDDYRDPREERYPI